MAIDVSKRISSRKVHEKKSGTAIVAGWASNVKAMGKLAFINLRDREGYIQLITFDKKLVKKLEGISKESVVLAEGKIKPSKQKAGGNEIEIKAIEVLSEADAKLPIDFSGNIETDLSKRLDYRILDLRNPTNVAIFKIRAKIPEAMREFLVGEGFVEMHTPKLVGAGAEGGAELFITDYYGKPAYLAQSQQLYKQLMNIAGFEKVFEIGPSFRAEKSHTVRHMSEFTQLDLEMSFIKSEEDIMKLEERLLQFVLKYIKERCSRELKQLGITIKIPKVPFPRITHSDAVKMLQKAGVKIKLTEDLGTDDEKKLGELIEKKYKTDAYFLTKFPWSLPVSKFYWMRNGKFGRGADLEYKGTEISTAAQREHRKDILVKQIKEKGLKPKQFAYYTEPFGYGAPPHGGFGFGIDRLTQLILNLPNIREATLFPRDPERLLP